MKLNEILDSGLLELFVLGQLSDIELREVEQAIDKYPEVKSEIFEIEKTLFRYDSIHKVQPPTGTLDKILSNIPDNTNIKDPTTKSFKDPSDSKSSQWGLLCGLLGALLLGSIFFIFDGRRKAQAEINEQKQLLLDCNEEKSKLEINQNNYAALLDSDSKKISVTPTEKYPETALVIYSNNKTRKNFIQINNLPSLANDQSYQLWSLKGDDPPRPLDVFENDNEDVIEVGFVEGTDAYAITIEPRGGQDSPTLANLIGVFNIQG